MTDDGLSLKHEDGTPFIGLRFTRQGGNVFFGLFADGCKNAQFSGLVGPSWPEDLREIADYVEQRIKEAERLG
jgi:hypothetical protein